LPPSLPQGSYRATFRVIAVDSHPASGSFVFSVGKPSPGGVALVPGEGRGSRTISTLFWLDRLLGYAAMALAVGGLFFLVQAWRPAFAGAAGGSGRWLDASAAFQRRFVRLVGTAVGVGLFASLLAIPLQGAAATEGSLWHALGGTVLGDVVHTRFGTLMV